VTSERDEKGSREGGRGRLKRTSRLFSEQEEGGEIRGKLVEAANGCIFKGITTYHGRSENPIPSPSEFLFIYTNLVTFAISLRTTGNGKRRPRKAKLPTLGNWGPLHHPKGRSSKWKLKRSAE